MGTRGGDVDPGVVLFHLHREAGMPGGGVSTALRQHMLTERSAVQAPTPTPTGLDVPDVVEWVWQA